MVINRLVHLVLESVSESDPNNMGDNIGEDGDKPDSDKKPR